MIKNNKTPVHVSIDLETLDKRPSAVVVSIGLAAFTVAGGEVATYYTTVKRSPQEERGRTVDPGTEEWWSRQSSEVREALDQSKAIGPYEALNHVTSFVQRFQNNFYYVAGVWGFGSDFDNAILIDMFGDFEMPVPWDYRANRCGRTLVRELGTPKPKAVGVHHNAADDAVWQARWFRQALMSIATAKHLGHFRSGT